MNRFLDVLFSPYRNIIVTEEKAFRKGRGRVVCKLTDFGLATKEAESEDVECGSRRKFYLRIHIGRPSLTLTSDHVAYMAVECRNNMGPSYHPPPADVWSLGIVLINMVSSFFFSPRFAVLTLRLYVYLQNSCFTRTRGLILPRRAPLSCRSERILKASLRPSFQGWVQK